MENITPIYPYPLLKKITEYFSVKDSGDLKSVYILACQHILEPQAKMFELFSDLGIPKENMHIFGKIYSTSNEILAEMQGSGFRIIQPSFDPNVSFDNEHKENCAKALKDFMVSIKAPSKIIILDDGGELLKLVNDSFDSVKNSLLVIGVEQTSSGFRKLENVDLKFPIFNVARSAIKLVKESPLIANLGCNRIIEMIKQYSIQEPRILVVGLGPMGSNTISILKNKGYFTLGYDTVHHDKAELIDLIKKDNINMVVGVTGSNILNEKQLQDIMEQLDHQLYLVSMSSADREFPTIYIRKNGIVSKQVHGDVVWDHIILINNGFPITFKGKRYESTPEEIEKTIALLYGSTLEAISESKINDVGFIDVPKAITDIIEKHE